MTDTFSWKRWQDTRATLPADVVGAIDAVGEELGSHATADTVLSALRARDVHFMHAIIGLMAIKDVGLGDAKWIVDGSPAYADGRQDRHDGWSAMYDEVMNDPDEQGPGAGTMQED